MMDDATGFGRMIPCHHADAPTAIQCLQQFNADLSKEAGCPVIFVEVLADNQPFDSDAFRDGMRKWSTGPVKVTTTAITDTR